MYPAELDDRAFVRRQDPHNMLDLVSVFPQQCRDALSSARSAVLPQLPARPRCICFVGMGGSGVAAGLVQSLLEDLSNIPALVHRDYGLPGFIGLQDLVVCMSYSGDTAEIVSAYHACRRAGAPLVVLTSGGILGRLASEDGVPLLRIPGGLPPRAALGYLTLPLVVALQRWGILSPTDDDRLVAMLEDGVDRWGPDQKLANEAKILAAFCHRRLTVVYGLGRWQSAVASHWKGQLNENAKVVAFAGAYPEVDHNELLGWRQADSEPLPAFGVIVLRDGNEDAQMVARAEHGRRLIGARCEFIDAYARGAARIERLLSLCQLGDYVSVYLAALRGVDPFDIGEIEELKRQIIAKG